MRYGQGTARFGAFAVLALGLSTAAGDQGVPIGEWARFWSDGGTAIGTLVDVAPDGSVYAAIASGNAAVDIDIALIKYAPDGTVLWERIYDGPGSGLDSPMDMAITPEGVSLVAVSAGVDGPETALLDFDHEGNLINDIRTIGPAIPGFLRPQLAIGADGRRVIATDDDDANATYQAYTAGGKQIYSGGFPMSGFSGVSALEIGADLSAYLVTVEEIDGDMAYVLRKIDPKGNEVWSDSVVGDTGLVLSDAFMTVMPDGGVVVVGSPEIPCVTVRSRVWRHAADGTELWSIDLPTEECDFSQAVGIAAGQDGEVYVAGTGTPSQLTRLDADGSIAWVTEYPGTVNMKFRGIDVAPDGRILVGGIEFANDVSVIDIRVICFDASGNPGWTTVIADPDGGIDSFTQIKVGPDGSVVLGATVPDPEFGFQSALTKRWDFGGCSGDLDGNDAVGVTDLVLLIGAWGANPGSAADLDGDGFVGVSDLVALITAWGTCGAEA